MTNEVSMQFSDNEGSDSEGLSRTLVYRDNNIIYFFAEVGASSVCEAIRHIDYLEGNKKCKGITLIINSAGGSAYDGLALVDRIKTCRLPVTTIGMGLVASMAFVIYVAGDKRLCTKNVSFLNHQIKANLDGSLTGNQIHIEEKETTRLENICVDIIASHTLLTPKKIKNDIKCGDQYIGAEGAIQMGISHEIIQDVQKVLRKEQ